MGDCVGPGEANSDIAGLGVSILDWVKRRLVSLLANQPLSDSTRLRASSRLLSSFPRTSDQIFDASDIR